MTRRAGHLGQRRAFTLVELIVASIVAAILTGAVATSISLFLKARSTSAAKQVAFARADAAAARMALEVSSVVRDGELIAGRIRITDAGTDSSPRDELLVVTELSRPVRDPEESPEGGEYECQYRIMPAENGEALWRRVDHAFDDNLDGGGIAAPFVPRILGLSVEATDGADWYPNWDSDSDGYPHAVRITVIAASDDGATFATARRVVAIDRVPLPAAEPEQSESNPESSPSSPTTQPQAQPTGGGGFVRETPGGTPGGSPRGTPGGTPGRPRQTPPPTGTPGAPGGGSGGGATPPAGPPPAGGPR